MEQLNIDTGVREYRINGKGVLRFNPSDPNLYGRFLEAMESIQKLKKNLRQKGGEVGNDAKKTLHLILQADRDAKEQLKKVFGEENDFDELLNNVNVMAVCENGERVISNLIQALSPILEEGAKNFLEAKARCAVEQAEKRRSVKHAR